jgi:hypothetical protein
VRHRVRENLGLAEGDSAVLFCTAGWQHGMKNPDGRRHARAVAELLWSYLAEVGPSVRLVHVGPAALPLESAGDRYLWVPSLTPLHFDHLLGGVDLFLSANISATTIGRAIAMGVPVVVVQNSYRADTAEEVERSMGANLSSRLKRWLKKALPLYPFSMWPLGYREFLKPLLQGNPYVDAMDVQELLDESGFIEACRLRLFDKTGRGEAIARQDAYATHVRKLPSAAQLIDTYLG